MKTYSDSGAMLLYAVITSMVISFICVTIVMLMLNQNIIAENEVKRTEAYHLARAGLEYAYEMLGSGLAVPTNLPNHPEVNIEVLTPDPDGISNSKVSVTVEYGED